MLRISMRGALVVLGLLLGASPLKADDSHYQDHLVGGRAVSLGGAFASIADDPSGLFYNPAGIVDSRQLSLQVSTSLYGFERGSYNVDVITLPIPGVDSLSVEFTDLIIVPVSAGAVKTFGKKGPDGLPTQAYSFSIMVPSYRSSSIKAPYSSGGETNDPAFQASELSYGRRVTDRSLWTGVGYAKKLSNGLRLGVGAHYVLRSMVAVEEVSSNATLTEELSSGADPEEVFQLASNDISFINGSLVLVAGLKYRSRRFSYGLSLRSPSLQVHSRAELRFENGKSIPEVDCADWSGASASPACGDEGVLVGGGTSQFWSPEPRRVESETKHPPAIRAGVSYSIPYKLTLSAALIYHFPTSYTLLNLVGGGTERLPFNPKINRNQVLNFNLGFEYLLIREVSFSVGVFSDFSSADPLRKMTYATEQQPDIDLGGFVLSLGYFGEHALSRVGLLYNSGHGYDVIPVNDVKQAFDASQDFQRVDYFQSFFYLFLSSTFRY